MANKKIEEVEGIGPATGEKLRAAGVPNTDKLLEKGRTREGRAALADATGLSEKQVQRFVNMADLFRIKGVGGEFAELLEAGGVDTVVELATRNAANLQAKLDEVNAEKKLTRRVPSLGEVERWVKEAGELPRAVEY